MSDSGTDVAGTTIDLGEIRKTLKKTSSEIMESRENEEFYFGWVLGRGRPLHPFAHQIARVVPLVYIITWHVWLGLYRKSSDDPFFSRRYAYLTCWASMFVTMYFLLAAILPLLRRPIAPWMLRLCSFFLYAATTFELVVVPMFWATEYKSSWSAYDGFMATHEHVFTSLAIFAEFFFTRVPIYPWDAAIIVGLALEYAQVNVITTLATEKPLYNIMSWKDGKSYAYFFGMLFATIVFLALEVVYRRWQEGTLRNMSLRRKTTQDSMV